MKKLIFILLLTPTLLFAQKQSTTTKHFRIQANNHKLYFATINGIYDDTASKSNLLSIGRLQAISSDGDTAQITSFTLSVVINGSFIDEHSNSSFFSGGMVSDIKQVAKGANILFQNIQCITAAGDTKTLEGFFIIVDSAKQPIRFKRKPIPAFLVTLDGDWKSQRIQLDTLIKIGKLDLLGTFSDSTKIIGFTLAFIENGLTTLSYNSNNGYLTPKMVSTLKQMVKGGNIEFRNIKCKTEEGMRKMNKLTVQVYP